MNRNYFFIWLLASFIIAGCSHGQDDPPLPPEPDPKPEPDPDEPDNPDNPNNPDPEPTLVPIELYTSLLSRVAVDRFDGTPVGLAMGLCRGEIEEQWDAVAGEGVLSLSSEHYYPTDSSDVCLWGFYPRTMLSEGKAGYRLTGKEDILYADMKSGSLRHPFSGEEGRIVFRHVLAQMNVSLQTGKEFEGTYRLKYLALEGSSTSATLDIMGGKMEFGDTPMQVVLYQATGSKDVTVEAGSNLPLGNFLVQPGAELVMDLVLAKDNDPENDIVFKDVKVDFEGGESESGLSYDLSVNLPDKLEPDEPDNPDVPDQPDTPDPPDIPDTPDTPDENPSEEIRITVTIRQWIDNPYDGNDLDIFK